MLALDKEDVSHFLSITSLALSPFKGVTLIDISTSSVSRRAPSGCLQVGYFVVYGISKLWRYRN